MRQALAPAGPSRCLLLRASRIRQAVQRAPKVPCTLPLIHGTPTITQGPSVSHFCGRSRPGAILVTPCHSTPSGSSPQQPEGDLEISDGTGSLEAVQTALKEADDGSESSIGSSSKKGSSGLKGIVVRLGAVCSITALIWAIFDSGNAALRIAAGVVGGSGFGAYGFRKNSLDASGAVSAALVGCCTLISSFRCTVVLLAFFFASSAITRIGEHLKDIDDEHKAGGQRDWKQVLCNGGPPSVLVALSGWVAVGADLPLGLAAAPGPATWLAAAFMGYYACCCGDTWASELGVLSKTPPRLITNLKTVRPGTNGGVSPLGLAASLGGGLFVGICFALGGILAPGNPAHQALFQQQALVVVMIGSAAGLFGSLVDSVLGATIQFTGYNNTTKKITSKRGPDVTHISGISILDNNAVNLVSASVTATATGLLTAAVFL